MLGRRSQSHSADPICIVEIGPQTRIRKSTEHKADTVNPLWEQTFFFQDVMLTEDQFKTEKISCRVYDRSDFNPNQLIGSVEISLSFIYRKKHRAIQKQWLTLTVPETPTNERGYLLLTAHVLKPGDAPPTFESFSAADSALDVDRPFVSRKLYQMNVLVYRGEHILWSRDNGVNVFVSVRFNGNALRTSSRPNQHTPVFNRRFELPFFIPLTSDSIEIQVWNGRRGLPDALIATIRFPVNELTYKPWGPKWKCFYTQSESPNLIGSLLDKFRGDEIEPTEYAGRLLLRLSVSPAKRPKLQSLPIETVNEEPVSVPYMLTFRLYSGSDIPVNGGQLMVEISFCGKAQQTDFVSGNNGEFIWNSSSTISVATTEDLEQVPDVIITLNHKLGILTTKLAYLRIPACKLKRSDADYSVNADLNEGDASDWSPRWRPLRPVRSSDDNVVPGFLLCTLAFGYSDENYERSARNQNFIPAPRNYNIRCRIIQAVNLPAATETNLSNPFAVLRVGSKCVSTNVKAETLFPLWNESLVLPCRMDVKFAPKLFVRIYHQGSFNRHTLLARADVQISAPNVSPGEKVQITRIPLYLGHEPDYTSRDSYLLASFETFEASESRNDSGAFDHSSLSELFKLERYGVFIQSIGLRGMIPYRLSNIVEPYVEVSIPNWDGSFNHEYITKTLKASTSQGHNEPSGSSVNIRGTLHFENILVPTENMDGFALLIRVYDNRTTGPVPIAYRYIPLSEVLAARDALGLRSEKPESVVPWKNQFALKSSAEDGEIETPTEKAAFPEEGNREQQGALNLQADAVNVIISTGFQVKKPGNSNAVEKLAPNDALHSPIEEQIEKAESSNADRLRTIELYRGKGAGLNSTEKTVAKGEQQAGSSVLSKRKRLTNKLTCGAFKAIVVAVSQSDFDYVHENIQLTELLDKPFVVRVYCYRGINLPPPPYWILSQQLRPYIYLTNGANRENIVNDKDAAETDALDELNPQFNRTFELRSKFPENYRLEVAVWNTDRFGSDNFIGSTVLDLESLITSSYWRKLNPTQRIESRILSNHASPLAQGKLEMRVDILGLFEAQEVPAETLTKRQPEQYELRLVIWSTHKIRFLDERDEDVDQSISVKANFEGQPGRDIVKYTDTAWNAGTNAEWNYRMTFPVSLPCKAPRMTISVWDENYLYDKEAIGDVVINFESEFNQVYREKKTSYHRERGWYDFQHPEAPDEDLGSVNIEYWIISKEDADRTPVGEGQKEPNRDPFLPKPSRKPPPWAVGSKLLDTFELIGKRKTLLLFICCLVVIVPLVLPFVVSYATR